MLAELADRQHGVVARRQVEDRGVTRRAFERRVASGRLVRLHRGVYAVGHARLRREGWWMAAVLAAGPGALLSHRDAAALHGLLPIGDHRRVEVATARRAAQTAAVHVRRTVLGDADATRVDRIPVTTIARTLVDLAGSAPARLPKALDEAERSGRLDVAAIEEALARVRTRNGGGHAAMTGALADSRAIGTTLTRSELEDRFLALLAADGLPHPLTNHWIAGMEVDFGWPRERVAVETDGWDAHRTRQAFQADRERGNALELAGWRLLRFTWSDVVRRPRETAAIVRAALARPRRYPPTP